MKVIDIDIENVPQFSQKDRDYLLDTDKFSSFTKYDFDLDEIPQVIAHRQTYSTDRKTLVEALQNQYKSVETSPVTLQNLNLLSEDKTFTFTTAHQPNLLTGPLYSIYKILSVIRISQLAKEKYPDYNFVPVFVIGSEDHDFEEVNHLHLFKKKIVWDTDQSGSVGQFDLSGLAEVITEIKDILGEQSKAKELIEACEAFAKESSDYVSFSFKVFHYLFDQFGLVILNMDRPILKSKFGDIIAKEIIHQSSVPLVRSAQEEIKALGYEPQTYIRDINFFYRKKGIRNRIEKTGDSYQVVDTDIVLTKDQIIEEAKNQAENFSPNVLMRPLYQEVILPNLAYVGGGGEISYWLERKTQFGHYGVPFPMLIRRTSALITSTSTTGQAEKIGLGITDFFQPSNSIIKQYLTQSDSPDYLLDEYKNKIEELYSALNQKITDIDKSLLSSANSEKTKSLKSMDYLSAKLKKSIKAKESVNLNRIEKIRSALLPENGLQERRNNILEYISMYGEQIIEMMLPHCNPFDKKLKLFVMQPEDR